MHNGSAAVFGSACGGSIPSSPATLKMQNKQEEIKKIIQELSNDIFNVNSDQKTAFIIKEIDKLVQKGYTEIYNVTDTKYQLNSVTDKHGHCC